MYEKKPNINPSKYTHRLKKISNISYLLSVLHYREHNSRKMSRQCNNADIFNNLLITSDPVISSSRKFIESKIKELSENVTNFLEFDDNDTNLNSFY